MARLIVSSLHYCASMPQQRPEWLAPSILPCGWMAVMNINRTCFFGLKGRIWPRRRPVPMEFWKAARNWWWRLPSTATLSNCMRKRPSIKEIGYRSTSSGKWLMSRGSTGSPWKTENMFPRCIENCMAWYFAAMFFPACGWIGRLFWSAGVLTKGCFALSTED